LEALKKPAPASKEVPVPEATEEPAAAVTEEKTEEAEAIVPKTTQETEVTPSTEKANAESPEKETLQTQYTKLSGPKKTGQTINLDEVNKKEKTVEDARKRKRKRISKDIKPTANKNKNNNQGQQRRGRTNTVVKKEEPSEEEVQKQIRETLEKLQGKSNKSKGAKYRRDKRVQHRQKSEEEMAQSRS
jgi:translation initiation factor IF-2